MNTDEPVLRLTNIHKSFGSDAVLKGVDLVANRGEVLTLLGRSGAGKSTLLRCINLLEQPDVGEMTVSGTRLSFPEAKRTKKRREAQAVLELRRKTGMVFQSFNLWTHKTVLENVIEAPVTVMKMKKKEAIERAKELLAKVGLFERQESYPSQLSGGQQQRVAIARALAIEPQLLLFDEPTSALDPELVGEVLKVMGELAAEGRTMLIVTHELGFARDVSTKMIFLDKGHLLEQGTPDQVLNNPSSEQFTTFLARSVAEKNLATA